jgi:hypothetical protein
MIYRIKLRIISVIGETSALFALIKAFHMNIKSQFLYGLGDVTCYINPLKTKLV